MLFRSVKLITASLLLSIFTSFVSFAGWKLDSRGWKYEITDGAYLKDGWEWIDGNQDGVAECYYFGKNGYMSSSRYIDGYRVNADGKWTIGNSVQTKMLSSLNGWQTLNGAEVYINNGQILRNQITPDNVYVDSNGHPVKSSIDPFLMAEKSKNCRYIAISKSSHFLELWESGDLKQRFVVNTGRVTGDKEVEGDKKTPEGEFYVCKKIPTSNYHLALGVSYPAIEDAERGIQNGLITQSQYNQIVAANMNGTTPDWHTNLGGYIEIHGCRSDISGTSGCISMRNEDIDLLYDLTETGDRIVIFH